MTLSLDFSRKEILYKIVESTEIFHENKYFLKLYKVQRNTVDCVDTTLFPLQATVFFSDFSAVFNGFVFARGV